MPSFSSRLHTQLAVAVGLFAAGLAVGLLLAPEPGTDARRRLATGAQHAGQSARRRAADAAAPVGSAARARADAFARRHVPLAGDWDVLDGDALREDLRRGRL